MSAVDKFGRRESVVKVERETKRTVREDIGFRLNDDGHLDVENKKIRNLGEPIESDDAVSLRYVQDRCVLLESDGVNFKKQKLTNVGTPVDAFDATNKFYVDNVCLQYGSKGKGGDETVINAREHRITMIGEPRRMRDVVSKRYVDERIFKKDQNGNIIVGNVRLTQVEPPHMNKDAVNLEFLNENTLKQAEYINAYTKRETDEVKRYTNIEMYTLAKVLQTRLIAVIDYLSKTRQLQYLSDDEELWKELVDKTTEKNLIEIPRKESGEKYLEIGDWRSVFHMKDIRNEE